MAFAVVTLLSSVFLHANQLGIVFMTVFNVRFQGSVPVACIGARKGEKRMWLSTATQDAGYLHGV
jgi:hypothetical protein